MSRSFAEQLESQLDSLWRFALRLSRSTDLAQELVQKTSLRGLEKQHQLKDSAKAREWLFSIMVSIWRNDLRKKSMQQKIMIDGVNQAHENASVPQGSDSHYFFSQIVDQVDQLPEAQREVMLLVCVEGYNYREAADILDVPIGTVMSRLSRARMAIGEFMLKQDSTEIKQIVNRDT